MKYYINFSKYINERFSDHWKWQTVEAKDETDAMQKLIDEHNKDGKHINYFLSCNPSS